METRISEEEFMRLQDQLISLRTANYALEEQNAAHVAKNKEMIVKVETLQKECNKLSSSLSSSRRMKGLDLFSRNEVLQLKLQTQEDDFRLQNETLLKELALLDAENKKLQSRVGSDEVECERPAEVKKLKEEASALQRVLSEERLRSANEICKLRTALNLVLDGVDEDIKESLCPGLESEIFEGKESVKRTCVCSPVEFMTERKDSDDEGYELMTGAEGVDNECKDLRCKLAETKEKLELWRSKWGLEYKVLADLVKNRKDDFRSLKAALGALEGRFHNCRTLGDQMIHELEKQLVDAMEDCNVIKQEKKDLEGDILGLKKEISENSLESEIVHAQLVESMKNVEKLKICMETLKADNASLTESADKLKMELIRKDEMIDDSVLKQKQLVAEYDDTIQIVKRDKEDSEHKLEEMIVKLQELQEKHDSLEKTSVVKDQALKELEQHVADLAAERALIEKKGSVICRDLKRQLALERRRAEKLQEKMRDLDTSTINSKQDSSKAGDAEVTSVSSWSLMSGNTEPQEASMQESQITGSPVNINGNAFSQIEEMDLEQENKGLLERLTALQEEKWLLEEKINHLEQGSAAMAEDLMKKAELIKFYCMDTRQDPHSSSGRKGVKKLSEFLKGSEGENMQESHARMQRMLEETLTKNMYLQRDVEHLSQELETLRHQSKIP